FMLIELRSQSRAGHGMPLITNATGIQRQGIGMAQGVAGQLRRNGDEVGPTAGGEVALVCEETWGTLGMGFIDRPLDRLKSVVIGLAEVAKAGDIKIPEALCRRIFKAREGCM